MFCLFFHVVRFHAFHTPYKARMLSFDEEMSFIQKHCPFPISQSKVFIFFSPSKSLNSHCIVDSCFVIGIWATLPALMTWLFLLKCCFNEFHRPSTLNANHCWFSWDQQHWVDVAFYHLQQQFYTFGNISFTAVPDS